MLKKSIEAEKVNMTKIVQYDVDEVMSISSL